jgi:hypothetical protein
MEITLNVLVYGLERSAIEALVADALAESERSFDGSITPLAGNRQLPGAMPG